MRWHALPLLALAASALLPLVACDGKARLHAFTARFWNASEGCLESEAVVDVIDGSDPGECPRTQCWVTPAGDAYVTTDACVAPLDFRDGTHDPAPSICADALEALAAGEDGSCGA